MNPVLPHFPQTTSKTFRPHFNPFPEHSWFLPSRPLIPPLPHTPQNPRVHYGAACPTPSPRHCCSAVYPTTTSTTATTSSVPTPNSNSQPPPLQPRNSTPQLCDPRLCSTNRLAVGAEVPHFSFTAFAMY